MASTRRTKATPPAKSAAKAAKSPAKSPGRSPGMSTASKNTASKNTAAKNTAAKKAPSKKATATKKAPSKKTSATKKAPATKAPATKAPAKTAPTKKALATKAPAKKATAKKAPAAKSAPAKKVPATKSARASRPSALVVGPGEKSWTAKELAGVRAQLQEDIERLRGEADEAEDELVVLMRDAGDGAGNDQADVGSATFERDQELTIANNVRDMLQQSEHALERIADGSYGVCESCGRPIGKARLQVFPRATLCVLCKQREERR